VLLELNECVR
jgi:peptidoglycan hydrolase CwlO-like protein